MGDSEKDGVVRGPATGDGAPPGADDGPHGATRRGSDPAASPEQAVRALRAAGRLADAAELVDQLGSYGVAEDYDATTSLGAAVLEAYGDLLAADPRAADAAYRRAAEAQRLFAAAATSGGEGTARMAEAGRIEAKRHA